MIDKEFLPGCELWVAPDLPSSPWRWSLEWSLNFQIAKTLTHKPRVLSESFLSLIEQQEATEFVQKINEDSPWTMIASEHLIPAKWFLLSGPLSKEEFQKTLDTTWENLGSPKTRIFTSKSWTKDMIEGLKSKCIRDEGTEIFDLQPSR